MSDVQVLLTVGKLDASLALLTTEDHHVIEFPTMLLPDDVKAGSIVKLSVSQNLEEEKRQRELFKEIQTKILEKYGTHKPELPVLYIVNVTQTSCVLAWDPLRLGSARLKSLILYRQGVRSTIIPSPLKGTTTKISGLSVDTDYEFQLKLSTTSGQYWSEKVKMHTHKMTDMSGITVCLGALDPMQNISAEQVSQSLAQIGAKPLQRHVAIDTTHFVTNDADNEEDPDLIKAKNNNIPIVRPEWVRASEMERRIVGVRGFYLDADPGILKSYQFPPLTDEAKAKFSKLKAPEDKFAEAEPATVGIQKELHAVNDNNGTSNKVENTPSNLESNEEHGEESEIAASASNKAMESVEDIPLAEEDLKDAVEATPDQAELKEPAEHPTDATLEEEEHAPAVQTERELGSELPQAEKEKPVAIEPDTFLKGPEEGSTIADLKEKEKEKATGDLDAVVGDAIEEANENETEATGAEAEAVAVAAEAEAEAVAVAAEAEAEAEAVAVAAEAEAEAVAVAAEAEAEAEAAEAEAEAAEAKTVTEEMTEAEVTPVGSYHNESDAQNDPMPEHSANVITSGEPLDSTQENVEDAEDEEENTTHDIEEPNEEGDQEVSRNTTPGENGNSASGKSSKKKKDKKKRNKKK